MAAPDFNGLIRNWWGGALECSALAGIINQAGNIILGVNPAYTLTDFLNGGYPYMFGPATLITADTVQGSASITVSGTPVGLAPGQLVVGSGIPGGATVVSYSAPTLTISQSSNATSSGVALSAYETPLIPLSILTVYLNLAMACVLQARWLDSWGVAMGLYIAHFATLWMKSAGNPNSTVGQAAASGLAFGLLTSKAVGGVSGGYVVTPGLESWGAWNLTTFGQQLATMARGITVPVMYIFG